MDDGTHAAGEPQEPPQRPWQALCQQALARTWLAVSPQPVARPSCCNTSPGNPSTPEAELHETSAQEQELDRARTSSSLARSGGSSSPTPSGRFPTRPHRHAMSAEAIQRQPQCHAGRKPHRHLSASLVHSHHRGPPTRPAEHFIARLHNVSYFHASPHQSRQEEQHARYPLPGQRYRSGSLVPRCSLRSPREGRGLGRRQLCPRFA